MLQVALIVLLAPSLAGGLISSERESGGWGLGLAITAAAIETQGGSISASNQTGGGLCVTICLPRQ